MKERSFGFVGGDKRNVELMRILEKEGYLINYFEMCEDIEEGYLLREMKSLEEIFLSSDCVIFGIPMFRNRKLYSDAEFENDAIEKIKHLVREEQSIYGGVIPQELKTHIAKKKGLVHDFMEDETYAIFNAISVAEGVIFETMKQRECNIHQSQCLVLGFGRCGKVIADKLKGLSANVTVASRSQEELTYAKALGYQTLNLSVLKGSISLYSNIYNTIPALVIEKDSLNRMDASQLVIDVASGKGGVDYEFSKRKKMNCIHLLGIPGRYAPNSVAEKMAEIILNKL